jgi:Ca2+-binding EF-hand superfamily protein
MKRTLKMAIALSMMLMAGQTFANGDQHANHQAEGHDHAAMAPDFAKLDANSDGQIEKSELPKDHPMASHFDMMDKDKDGKVSKAEFDAMHASHDGH